MSMGKATSKLRDKVRAELDEYAERSPKAWAEEFRIQGGIERVTDFWLAIELRSAVRAIYKGRYSKNERVRMAIANARNAMDELQEALRIELRFIERTKKAGK